MATPDDRTPLLRCDDALPGAALWEQALRNIPRREPRLGGRTARIVALRDEGLTYAEIAEREGCTVSLVGTLLTNARKAGVRSRFDGVWARGPRRRKAVKP